ncbi:keratin-associated protein 10-4 [Dermacentor silvarum]|uniref:keratin-associated protein 10-4 n=1 Tax=Dermacentor silvarum TaxID=543639 RepID=UPI00189C53FF|nr:keratin-associated protein 10-4 [Dermacentor silvarum]
MYAKDISFAVICILLSSGPQITHSIKCGCLERPAKNARCRDMMCSPYNTPESVKNKVSRCVCRLGAYRNPWGHCISLEECKSCGTYPHKSYNLCASECPLKCDQPIQNCSSRCVARCDCAPGYVLDRTGKDRCVKADCCPPKCPPNSTFKLCVSNCRPMCGRPKPRNCYNSCTRGGCVCNNGFSEVNNGGTMICVQNSMCNQYLPRNEI